MMTKEQKNEVIKSVKDQITKSQALFLTNLVGIEANSAVQIRKGVREAKGFMMIAKNSLIEKAAQGTYAEKFLTKLKGNNAIAFAYDDAPAVAKVIFDANKELELVSLKGGMLGDKTLSSDECNALAKLPSKPQMLATLLATFNAPVSAFVRTIDAIKRQKEETTNA
jgi:large subunit ribosomal protein L10